MTNVSSLYTRNIMREKKYSVYKNKRKIWKNQTLRPRPATTYTIKSSQLVHMQEYFTDFV